jgi:perosamine synthetase
MSIPVFKPSIRRGDMDAVLTCLVNDNLSAGQVSQRFIHEVSEYTSLGGGLAVRELSRALKLTFQALGLPAGSRIGLSALAPRIYDSVCHELGMQPEIFDVEPDNACISVESLKQTANPLNAIICHYALGFVPHLDRIAELGVPIIEDLSQGLGAVLGEKKGGTFGAYTIISLEQENIITAGGGALLLGRSKKEALVLKKIAEDLPRELLLPDMNSALGLTQIKEIEKYLLKRREIAQIYQRSLMQSRQKTLLQTDESGPVPFSFPVLVETGLKDIQAFARKKGIETQPAFTDSILSRLPGQESRWPVAFSLMLRTLLFPLFPSLKRSNIELVAKVLAVLP